MSETATLPTPTAQTPANGVATETKRKPGRPANGESTANKKPGFTMKQLSTSTSDNADKIAAQWEMKSHTVYSAAVLVFQTLSPEDQLKVLMEAKKLHAAKVKEEQEKAA